MFEALIHALTTLMTPYYLQMLGVGVLIGLVAGAMPGIGSTVTLAVILPFIFGFDPVGAVALLIGAISVISTSDSISSVLFAVPGTGSSVATIVDGNPMAHKGEAARALSAAFTASAAGGLIGVMFLALSVPLFSPLLGRFASPEFLMLTILGVSMTAVLTGRRPLKGLIAGGAGLFLTTIGTAPGEAYVRYTSGILYLYEGLPLVVVILGIFAMPEIVDLMIIGKPIAGEFSLGKGVKAGILDVIKAWWLVIRSSAIGAYIGFLPGLGGPAAAWIAYGHAVQSAKDRTMFGHGDVRGVIAPEASNNASRGGELIPTLLFGVPGSGSTAVLMAGLIVFGIFPGPRMVTERLDIVYVIMWSLAIGTVLGAAICMLLIKPLARLTKLPINILAPFIFMVVTIGAYQTNQHWGDLILLVVMGLLGWLMKRFEFSRPALVVGFVLGALAEKYLYLSLSRYGADFLLRPAVLVIGMVTIVSLVVGVRWQSKRGTKESG